MRKRGRAAALALALALLAALAPAPARADGLPALESGVYGQEKLTQEKIAALFADEPKVDPEALYQREPDLDAPYEDAGKIAEAHNNAALTRLNDLRRLAGLPPVTIEAQYEELAQAGAYVNALYGALSHYPGQAEGLGNSLYALGAKGAASSNIAWSSWKTDLVFSVDLWVNDTDEANISKLGHRRWALNPTMDKTGFGYCFSEDAGSFTAMYSFSRSGPEQSYDFLSWPASGNFPAGEDFFESDTAWSITLNPKKYAKPSINAVKVTLTRESDGRQWEFSGPGQMPSATGDYFNVEGSNYGVDNCIIFRPSGIDSYDGRYTVTVTGLKTPSGDNADFTYSVDFFDLQSAIRKLDLHFSDAPEGGSYTPAILWGVKNGYVDPVSDTAFGTYSACPRWEVVAMLWNACGSPKPTSTQMPFTDVPASAPYYEALLWAYEKGVAKGVNETVFSPESTVERAAAMTFIHRAAGEIAAEADNPFTDVPAEGAYTQAILWAVSQTPPITSGTSDTAFSPYAPVERGQMITFLYRWKTGNP